MVPRQEDAAGHSPRAASGRRPRSRMEVAGRYNFASLLTKCWADGGRNKGAIVTRCRVVRMDRLAVCRARVLALVVLGLLVFEPVRAASSECAAGLTKEDAAGVRAVVESYR